jgi:putative Holliday junction resolvase
MTLMSLDVGERRIGIAISQSGILATPHSVLHRKSKKADFARLQQIINKLGVVRLIIGIPYSVSGYEKVGPQARRVKRYADALAKVIDVPIEFFDESYSTVDAEAFLQSAGQKKVPIDAAAAAVILQNYLDDTETPSQHLTYE